VLERTRFVLVQPQSGGNVGSAARAMKNLGFSRLLLVDPHCDPLGREARMMAVEARDVLEGVAIHADLAEALAGATTVVGTTRRLGKHRRPHFPLDEAAPRLTRLAAEGELALVFGREDRGLTDAELDRATDLVYLRAAEIYPSFNLAQAVLLAAYELQRASGGGRADTGPAPVLAGHAEREGFYAHLERALWAIGFLGPDSREVLMRRLRRIFGRTELTREEVKLLRGIARQTLWAASRAGLDVPAEDEEGETSSETSPREAR